MEAVMNTRVKDKPPKLTPVKLKKSDNMHPWRLCPKGYHYVRTHSLRVPPNTSIIP